MGGESAAVQESTAWPGGGKGDGGSGDIGPRYGREMDQRPAAAPVRHPVAGISGQQADDPPV
jgi:hypothetical protein